MKATIAALVASIAVPFLASASPLLLLETAITEHHESGGPDVMTVPQISTESGKQAVIQVGTLEYAVTPVLLDDGTVDFRAVVTVRHGDESDVLAVAAINAKIDQVAEIRIGDLTFTTRTSPAK